MAAKINGSYKVVEVVGVGELRSGVER